VDARHGVRVQSRRHAQIAQLLGIRDYVLAVNKMDLIDFDRGTFDEIVEEFRTVLPNANLHPIPISALDGDNVITKSERTPWFDGKSLLEYLETVEVDHQMIAKPFRMPVQLVARPDQDFRGYAGQVLSGAVRPGDTVTVYPSGRTTKVARIVTWDGDLDVAQAGMSITLTLSDELDISRGDVITVGPIEMGRRFRADVVWMDERPLDPGRVYLLKQGTRTVTAEINHPLMLNQIGNVEVSTARPIVFDRYTDNRGTGSFILIDPATQFTCGAGMITDPVREAAAAVAAPMSAAERIARLARHAGSDDEAIDAVRKALEEMLA
jgi:sulfate adenylyltransferase subunit 1 (EFTu-like GTPase family)